MSVDSRARPTPTGVLVLGMHRSGTSAATRIVNLMGLSTCPAEDFVRGHRGNPTGHWESQSLVDLNDAALGGMGRSWWCPPPAPGAAYDAAARNIGATVDEARRQFDLAHGREPWVWKDPRATALLPFWREVLHDRVAVVAVYRDPLEVAQSLQARNGFSEQLGVAMWERYNRLLLAHLSGLPVLLSCYDALIRDPQGWAKRVRSFLVGAGLPAALPPTGAVDEFVQGDLRHHIATEGLARKRYPGAATVLAALDHRAGRTRSFRSPALPEELPWVEAELQAAAAGQARQPPAPAPPITSLLYEGGVDPELSAGHEVVTVVRGGQPLGLRRNRAAERSGGAVLVFVSEGARVPTSWWAAVRGALAAGHSAVGPAVRTPSGDVGCGLTWTDRWLNRKWLPAAAPAGGVHPVLLLPGGCLAVTRQAFEAVGGFDPALGAHGLESDELCLRLWRAGYSCAVTEDVVAELPDPGTPAGGGVAGRFLHDLIRLASVHLDAEDAAFVLDGLRATPGMAAAAAEAALGDLGLRRRMFDERGWLPTSQVLARFGVVLDPSKHARAARRERAGPGPTATRPQGSHELVFVGGLHGSGLGLVTRLLASHPLVSTFNGTGVPGEEGQHLQDLLPSAREHGGPGRFALHCDAPLDESSPLAHPETARRLFGQWSPHWDLSRPVLVEKSPPNQIRGRLLQSLFPGSRLLVVQRHPVAVVLETAANPVEEMEDHLANWFTAWERLEADRELLESCLVTGYEQFLVEPDEMAAKLWSWLELDPVSTAGLVDPSRQDAVEERWRAALAAGGQEWWEKVRSGFAEKAEAYGYDLDAPTRALEPVAGP